MSVQKQFVMYKNIDVQRKVFLIKDHRCIVLVNVYKNKTKKLKRKEAFIISETQNVIRTFYVTRNI